MSTIVAQSTEVMYIAFRDYGFEPMRRFLASYRRCDAGWPHVLTIALKGYDTATQTEIAEVVTLFDLVGAKVRMVPDGGLDIGTYFHLAAMSDAGLLCLLNTNSVILADNWLARLSNARERQGGGAVAATGSWESVASDEVAVARLQGVSRVRAWARFVRRWRQFPAYPNPHLRTNGLLVARDEFLAIGPIFPQAKEEAFAFESGRAGLSATMCKNGRPIGIVGRDGRLFGPHDWDRSAIFWQGNQTNLLIGDNQTLRYRDANPAGREELTALAWRSPLYRASL